MSRWRAKGMAILHCRCQESTALLSVLNSCGSSLSRAWPRSAPPACLAHGSLEASIHTRRRRLHGADKRLSLGAASRRPVDAAPQSAFPPERIDRSCCWGWAAQLLHSCCERTERHGPAKSKDEDGTYYLSSRIQEMEVLTLLGTNFLLSEERGTKNSQSQKNHATSAGVDFQANGTHATGPHD